MLGSFDKFVFELQIEQPEQVKLPALRLVMLELKALGLTPYLDIVVDAWTGTLSIWLYVRYTQDFEDRIAGKSCSKESKMKDRESLKNSLQRLSHLIKNEYFFYLASLISLMLVFYVHTSFSSIILKIISSDSPSFLPLISNLFQTSIWLLFGSSIVSFIMFVLEAMNRKAFFTLYSGLFIYSLVAFIIIAKTFY